MPKNITATDLAIESLTAVVDNAQAVTGLTATMNVAYGETRVREEFDLWAELTAQQRAGFQEIYDTLVQTAQAEYLG